MAAALTDACLVDKSAFARTRNPLVVARLEPLLRNRLVHTCAMVDLEVLYSARNLADYDKILRGRRKLLDVPVTSGVMHRAIDIQQKLAKKGQHRCSTADLIIAAAAEAAGLAVVHYDSDFERIADVSGIRHKWIVERGTVC